MNSHVLRRFTDEEKSTKDELVKGVEKYFCTTWKALNRELLTNFVEENGEWGNSLCCTYIRLCYVYSFCEHLPNGFCLDAFVTYIFPSNDMQRTCFKRKLLETSNNFLAIIAWKLSVLIFPLMFLLFLSINLFQG